MILEFDVPGKVKAKQSVKFRRVQDFVKTYTPEDMVEYANWVKLCFKQKYPGFSPDYFLNTPLCLSIFAYLPIPKSYSKKKTELALKGFLRPIVKPDCDNITKNIKDALSKIAYPDDKQIVDLVVRKYYSKIPSAKIRLTPLNMGIA